MIQPIQPFCLSMCDLFYAEIICKSNCINLPFCAMIKLKSVLFIMRGYLDTYCSVFRSLLLSAIIWIPDVRSLPLDLFTLINFVIEQMHRAVFVLPTFAKKELEAYCFSTGRVSFYKSVFAITLYLLCFHSLRIFLKASSYWRTGVPFYRNSQRKQLQQHRRLLLLRRAKFSLHPRPGLTTHHAISRNSSLPALLGIQWINPAMYHPIL